MADAHERLTGGNTNPDVVRITDTVRRTAGAWTPTVHALLQHLEDRDYPAPRALGFDDEGREILTFVPGVPVHPDRVDLLDEETALRRVGGLITEYHRAQSSFVVPADHVWREEGRDPTGSNEVVAHNDLAPWNLIAGPASWVFIDWDLAAPGRRLWDLAWALHSFVGLWPDAPRSDGEIVRRIAAFCDGAEVERSERAGLLEVVVERTTDHAAMLRRKADEGDPIYERLVAEGHAERWETGASHVDRNRERWNLLLGI